jgi:hypothetical protein
MNEQSKLMIFVNVILGLIFIAINLIINYFGSIRPTDILWSPLWLTFYNARIEDSLGALEPNFIFYFFWVPIIVNVYFIYLLQKSNKTNPTSS